MGLETCHFTQNLVISFYISVPYCVHKCSIKLFIPSIHPSMYLLAKCHIHVHVKFKSR